jgi:hypothetical protein
MQSFQTLILDFINRHPVMIIGFALIILSSIGNLSTRKLKVNTNQRMSMMIFLSGFVLIMIDLYRNNTFSGFFSKPQTVQADISKPKEDVEIKRKIENYFATLPAHDFDRVRNFFPNILDKYFDEEKITMFRLSRRFKREWKTIKSESYDIQWDTWKYKYENGQHIVGITVLHSITPEKGEANQTSKLLEIRFDINHKITSIDTGIE